jgi:hypothetical protein
MGSVHALLDRAEAEGRDLTAAEMGQYERLLNLAKQSNELEKLGRDLGAGLGPVYHGGPTGGGPGDRFVKAQEYLRIKDPASRGQTWSTGPINVSDVPLNAKGTLFEPATASTSSAEVAAGERSVVESGQPPVQDARTSSTGPTAVMLAAPSTPVAVMAATSKATRFAITSPRTGT